MLIAPPPGRHVRRLHLRAAAEEDARQTVPLLCDALHTASLPGADGARLVAIRRLALGRISPRMSGAALALHIERIVREVALEAVPYDLPATGDANAVWFPDRSEALIRLARLHAAGAASREWFWPSVMPGWQPGRSRAERWQLLLGAAHGVPEAAVVAAAIVEQAVRAGVEDEVLSSIPPGEGAKWLRLEGWSRLDADVPAPPEQPAALRCAGVVTRWLRKWGPADDRLVWFGTLLLLSERPFRVADAWLPAKVAAALASGWVPAGPPGQQAAPAPGWTPAPRSTRPEPVLAPDELQPGSNPQADKVWRDAAEDQRRPVARIAGDRPAAEVPPHPRTEIGQAAGTSAPLPGPTAPQTRPGARKQAEVAPPEEASPRYLPGCGAFTTCAGLFLVVPILERLEFGAFVAAHPNHLEAGFPARLLWRIGRRAGLTPNEPLARAFQDGLMDHRPGEPERIPAFQVSDLPAPAREVLSAPRPRMALDSPWMAWTAAVRRWCRRHARMGLVNLVRRPGRVVISRTHIDVSFGLDQVDLRLRRLGLDVDPGWVPWLAHVIRFRYLDEDEHTC